MNNIEKIRQKLDLLYDGEAPKHDQQCNFDDGYFMGLATISYFIDSLSEEPDKSLEEAARLYAIPHYMKDIDVNHIEEYPYDSGLEAAFIAGSEWMAKQGVTFTAAVDHYEDFYLDSCDQEAEAIKKLGLKVMDWAIVQIRKK